MTEETAAAPKAAKASKPATKPGKAAKATTAATPNNKAAVKVGSVVECTHKGKKLRGTVTKTWVRKHRGRRAELAHRVGDREGLYTDMARFVIEGRPGYVEAPQSMLTVVEQQGSANALAEALDQQDRVTESHRARKTRVLTRNAEVIRSRGLDNLVSGEPVEVQYRSVGWKLRTFRGITESGKIRIEEPGNSKLRVVWPDHTRRVNAQD